MEEPKKGHHFEDFGARENMSLPKGPLLIGEMGSPPGILQVSDGSLVVEIVDGSSNVVTGIGTGDPSNRGRQLSTTSRDESRSDVTLETSGALDCSLVQTGGSSEEESDDGEDWPDGVEVECKLEEVAQGVVDAPSCHETNREQDGFSVSVNNTRIEGTRHNNACPSGKVDVKSVGHDGHVGVDNGIDSVNSSLLSEFSMRHLTRPYGCELCNYRGKYRSDLEAHMRTHTGEKPFACELCDYRGSHSSHLKYHMRTHTGEKPFVCSICDYRCVHAGRLKDHMMSHTGEKPYSCDLCEFKCSRTGILKRHIRMHTGEKPYACDMCNYRCSETGTLKTHKRIHTGEKPYGCDQCDYRSVQASALRKHKRTHASQNSQLTGH